MATPTCRDIVRRALRKLSRVAAGEEPNGDDAKDALEVLQDFYVELAGLGVFGRLNDRIVTADCTAREQDRVMIDSDAAVSVSLPDRVTSECFINGIAPITPGCSDYGFYNYYPSPRPPRDGACIVITSLRSEFSETWVYNANRARWEKINGLTLNSLAPLGERYREGIVCNLAMRLIPEFGLTTVPIGLEKGAAHGMYALTHRYDRQRTTAVGSYS